MSCGSDRKLEGTYTNPATLFSETFENHSKGELSTTTDWKTTSGTGNWQIIKKEEAAHGGEKGLATYSSLNDMKYENKSDKIVYYKTKIDATNYNSVRMTFWWKGKGEQSGNIWVDYGRVVYSTDGTTWKALSETYMGMTAWSQIDVDLSEINGQQFYIGFKWFSDKNTIKDPGFIIDDISITGHKNATYSWSPATGLSATNILSPICNATTTTTYTLTINSGGCTSTDNITVTVNNAHDVNVGADVSICEGNSVNLSGAYTPVPIENYIYSVFFNNSNNDFKVTSDNNSGNTWGRVTSFTNGNETISNDGSYFYRLQSDWTGDGSDVYTNSFLTSPAFATTGYSNVKLSFKHYFRQSAPNKNSTIKVDFSLDGSSWSTYSYDITGSHTNGYRIGSPNAFKDTTIALPAAFNNKATVYFRFNYYHSQDWSWSVDDIKVTADPTSIPTSSFYWSPTSSITSRATTLTPTVKPNTTTDYTLTVTRGACISQDIVRVNVDEKSTLPTSITVDNNTNNCPGRKIKLTEVGGVLKGSSQYIWGTNSGGYASFNRNYCYQRYPHTNGYD